MFRASLATCDWRRGATGVSLLTKWDSVAGLGRAPIPENISGRKLTRVLNSAGSVLVHLRYVTKRPRTGEGCDPGNSGVWERDYGWGVRVRRPFGARGMSSVRYGTRLGDLKNKQSTHTTPCASHDRLLKQIMIFGNSGLRVFPRGRLFFSEPLAAD